MIVEDFAKEIQSKNDITTRILKDIILDMKSVIRKQNIVIAILALTTLIGILYFVLSKIQYFRGVLMKFTEDLTKYNKKHSRFYIYNVGNWKYI